MRRVFYLSHPQVRIDPAVPVSVWALSPRGRARALSAAAAPWTAGVTTIVSSQERKAVETAEIIAEPRGIAVRTHRAMHENIRTGYLPPPEFEAMADAFFARPHESVAGWERAIDAQARIVAACEAMLSEDLPVGDVLFVGHGGVGTLLICHLMGAAISRAHDQPAGGGNVFAFDAETRTLVHGWRTLEELA